MSVNLIVSGKLVTDTSIYENTAIAIKDGKIAAIGNKDNMPSAEEEIDFGDLMILPGVVDAHTHSLGDPDEGHYNSTKGAAAGGVTTINDHPLDIGYAPTSKDDILKKAEKASKEAVVDFSLFAEGVPSRIDDILDVANSGITGYKILMHATSGAASYGLGAVNDGELYAMFELIGKAGQTAIVHAENDWIVNYLVEKFIKEEKTYLAAHNETRPEVTETVAVLTAIEIARTLNCRLHIAHASVPRTFEIVDEARREGVLVTAETCPHFLICNEDRWKDIGAQFKINPPLRSEKSRLLLWEFLRKDKIHLIASDHAPHPINHKPNVFDNFSGTPSIETLFQIMYSEGVAKGEIGINRLVKLLTINPAKLLGLYPEKGAIEIGSDADLIIFDPSKKWVLEGSKLHMQSGWSMYEGFNVTGKVFATYVRGKKVYEDGEVIGEKGYGKWIKKQNNYYI